MVPNGCECPQALCPEPGLLVCVVLFLSIFSPQQNTKELVGSYAYLVFILHAGLPKLDLKLYWGYICTHNIVQDTSRWHQSRLQHLSRGSTSITGHQERREKPPPINGHRQLL